MQTLRQTRPCLIQSGAGFLLRFGFAGEKVRNLQRGLLKPQCLQADIQDISSVVWISEGMLFMGSYSMPRGEFGLHLNRCGRQPRSARKRVVGVQMPSFLMAPSPIDSYKL